MKKITTLILLLSSITFFSQDLSTSVTGNVYYKSFPLQNVTIMVKGTQSGTTTDKKGYFKINAKKGNVLVFTHVAMKKTSVKLKNTSTNLKVQMNSNENQLDEVNVRAKEKELKLGFTNINPDMPNIRRVSFIEGSKLHQGAFSLIQAIQSRFPAVKVAMSEYGDEYVYINANGLSGTAMWDVDNATYKSPTNPPFIAIQDIAYIAVIKSREARRHYGFEAEGGVIIVKTKQGLKKNNPYLNKKKYKKDAVSFDKVVYKKPDYLNNLNDSESLLEYKKIANTNKHKANFHINVITHLQKKQVKKETILEILSDYIDYSKNNVDNLKIAAFKLQELNENSKAIEVYKEIAYLKPKHIQSYRDLANAYIENKEYNKARKIYNYYLVKGFTIEKNNIGSVLESEMISTYANLKRDSKLLENIKKEKKSKVLKGDVRMVFEWDSPESEFQLEFVNPEGLVEEFNHVAIENKNLISEEKEKGFTSREYMIEKIENGEWLVNFKHIKNNKLYKPTYLKLTTYYNWGRKNQRKIIKVYDFAVANTKAQIIKINKGQI